jgi:ATP-dependent protease ClpP protease subunit
MTELSFELERNVTRIWDLDVPIVNDKARNIIKAYLTSEISEPFVYNELCYLLEEADENCKVHLYLNTPGGIIDSAFMLIHAIKRSKAKVTAVLSGTVASAGTLIAMECDDIEVAPHLSFMVHNYSGGLAGKGHEMKARQKFVDEHLNEAFKRFYSGFLSKEEMDKVIEGTDLWMGSKEVLQRWDNRMEYLKGAANDRN